MKKNNFNQRTCIVTKIKKHKNELIRFVIKDKVISIDENCSLPGKGYYVSSDINIINELISKQILEKRFKVINANSFYEKINYLLGEKYESKKTNQEKSRYKKTS